MGGHPLRLEMVLTKRKLSGVAVVALAAALTAFWSVRANDEPTMRLAAWQRLAIPGDLSAAHSRLEDDCGACHTAVEGASRSKCMACHATEERLLTWPSLKFHASVPDCRACHREHLGISVASMGMDHVALATMGLGLLRSGESEVGRSVGQHLYAWIAESPVGRDRRSTGHLAPAETVLQCATCHAERDAHREMFGSDCAQCHATSVWSIPEYQHPSEVWRLVARRGAMALCAVGGSVGRVLILRDGPHRSCVTSRAIAPEHLAMRVPFRMACRTSKHCLGGC